MTMKTILLATALFLLLPVTSVLACMCPGYDRGSIENEVKAAVDGSSSVFVGKVTGFEYQKGVLFDMPGAVRPSKVEAEGLETRLVRFEVERWWKTELPGNILLLTTSTRKIAGDIVSTPVSGNIVELTLPEPDFFWNMCMVPLAKGKTYLIYATGQADKLQFKYCTRSTELNRAQDDLTILGDGQKPLPNKTKEN